MSEMMTAREHARRVAVLDVIGDETAKMLQTARDDAAPAFAEWRADGERGRLKAALSDGTEIGLVSVKAGGKSVKLTGDALEDWVRAHLPDGMEEYADDAVLTDAEVLDVLKAVFPHLVKSRIRAATRNALMKEIADSGGWLVDKATGDKEKVAEVEDRDPTGAFAFRPSPDAREQVIAAWRRGDLRDLGLGAIALPDVMQPGLGPSQPDGPQVNEPPEPGKPLFGPPFCDEHGFRDPVLAAAHALMLQSGFTTPPIEAYRMIRDGGVAADRALAGLAEVGLDPADPREGKDTPWPLPEVTQP